MSKLPPLKPELGPVWEPYGRQSHPDERDDQKLTEREQEQSTLRWVKARIERDGRGELDETPWAYDDETGLKADRPAYRRRLARARALRLQGRQVNLVVRQFDRIGRDAEELHRAYKELCALDVELHDVSMGGYVSPQVFPYLVANAHVGSITIGANVKRTNAQVRRDGWWRPARRPWGYAIVPATKEQQAAGSPKVVLALHPDEAESCRQAFKRVADGDSIHGVERWIAGLPAAKLGSVGRKVPVRRLGHQALGLLLRNPLYAGLLPDGTPGHWPAMVDRATWDKVQARFERRLPMQSRGEYLLTGLLWCPHCARRGQPSRMRGSANVKDWGSERRTYRRYRCSSTTQGAVSPIACYYAVVADAVERDVLRQVRPLFALDVDANRAELAREVGRLLGAGRGAGPLADLEARLRAADANIELARKRSGAALQLREDGEISREELADRLSAHRALREEGQREKQRAEAEISELTGRAGRRRLTVADVLGKLDEWRAQWLGAADDVRGQREYLAELVERVEPVRGENGDVRAHVTWTEEGALLAAAAELCVTPGDEAERDGPDTAAAG